MTWMQDPQGNVHEIRNYLRELTLIHSQGWKRITDQKAKEINQKRRAPKPSQIIPTKDIRVDDSGQQVINNALYTALLDDSSCPEVRRNESNDSCQASHKHSSHDNDSSHNSHGHSSDHGYSSGHDYSSHDYGGSSDSGSSGGDF
jgi:hypothetical protein